MPFVEVTVRYLEMTSPADLRAKRSPAVGIAFTRVEPPDPELNHSLYLAVGAQWLWLERRAWTSADWAGYAGNPSVETWVLFVDGAHAGYVELERLAAGEVELKYFGLLGSYIGRGLGAHLLTEAVQRAWAMGASRVILNTCNLDHPQALPNYLARGFREYRTEVKQKELPED